MRHRIVVSGSTGRSQARQAIAVDRIQAAAHLYASDFGEIKVAPNRFPLASVQARSVG